MATVNLKRAREHLGKLVDAASLGEETIITRRGRPVARLVPIEDGPEPLPDLTAFRESLHITGEPLSEIVIEERRNDRY